MKRLAVLMFTLLLLVQELQAEVTPSAGLPVPQSAAPELVPQQEATGKSSQETVFAYRTSMRSDETADSRGSSVYGLSIVPFETPVELAPVDREAWASARVGSNLTFRVQRDVIRTGGIFNRKSTYADANAGDLIEARVVRVREGKLRIHNGRTEPRVKEVLVGRRIRLALESSPAGHARFSAFAKNLVIWPVKSVVAVGEFTFLAIFCTVGGGCEI